MTWDGSVPVFTPKPVPSTSLQELADIATHLSQYMTDGAWSTYTPTVAGGGTATFSAQLGRYKRIAPRTVLVAVHLAVLVAGSGGSSVTFTLPTEPTRTVRTVIPGNADGGTALPDLVAITFTGGSGTTIDRIRYSGATNLLGSDLTAGKILIFTGHYEELA